MTTPCKKNLKEGETCPGCQYNKEKYVLKSTLSKCYYNWPHDEIAKLAGTEQGTHGNTPYFFREVLEGYKSPETVTKTVCVPINANYITRRQIKRWLRRYMHCVREYSRADWHGLTPNTANFPALQTTVVDYCAKPQAEWQNKSAKESRLALLKSTERSIEWMCEQRSYHMEAKREKKVKSWDKRIQAKQQTLNKFKKVVIENRQPRLIRLVYRASGNNSAIDTELVRHNGDRSVKVTVNISTEGRRINSKKNPGKSLVFYGRRSKLFNKYLRMAGGKYAPAMLYYSKRTGSLMLGVVFQLPYRMQNKYHPDEVCGIDLGCSWKDENCVVFHDGHRINTINDLPFEDMAKKVRKVNDIREKLGRKTKSCTRVAAMKENWWGRLAFEIINYCKSKGYKCIVLEDLKGIKQGKGDISKKQRRRQIAWSPSTLLTALHERAAMLGGLRVISVNPAGTSQGDARSGGLITGKRTSRGEYASADGVTVDADVNAACNTRAKGLERLESQRKLSVCPDASSPHLPEPLARRPES